MTQDMDPAPFDAAGDGVTYDVGEETFENAINDVRQVGDTTRGNGDWYFDHDGTYFRFQREAVRAE